MGKICGLEVEADAILDGAFTNSPERYAAYHGRVKKTQGESGVSSAENMQSLKVWLATLGKRSNSQTGSLAAPGSSVALSHLFRVINRKHRKRGTSNTRFRDEDCTMQLLTD